jgi:hypothetical protein
MHDKRGGCSTMAHATPLHQADDSSNSIEKVIIKKF